MLRKMYLLALGAGGGLVASTLTATAPAMARAAATETGFQGSTYGTLVTVGPAVHSGRCPRCPCCPAHPRPASRTPTASPR